MENNVIPRRGDIWYCDLGDRGVGTVQRGKRPVVVISNDMCNRFSNHIIVACLSGHTKALHLPTHVVINSMGELSPTTMLPGEQIHTVSKSQLCNKVGKCYNMDMVDCAVLSSLGF